MHLRATGSGLIAASSKLGGIIGAGLGVAGLFADVSLSALVIAVPMLAAAVLLARKGGGLERNPAAKRLSVALGNVSFLERPFHPTTLVSAVNTSLRGRLRQYEARERIELVPVRGEDSTAAQLMGIRPDTMQAIAWAIAAAVTGIAGALIATFFYIAPTVGETLGIVAFVTVSLGGFGSVPGALVAGLLIGVIESVSAYWIGAVYKDIVVYSLFLCFLWFRPQGLMGKS